VRLEAERASQAKSKLVQKCKKIRIYPDTAQKTVLRRWFGGARALYNLAIEYLQYPGTKACWMGIKTDLIYAAPVWCEDVPYQIKSLAIKDACIAMKNAKVKAKATGLPQRLSFRPKRDKRDSIFIPKAAVKQNSVYVDLLGKDLHPAESIPEEVRYDCRLIKQDDRYFLIVPVDEEIKATPRRHGAVALDPGMRTFQSFYSPEVAGKFGARDFGRIFRLCSHMDMLLSKASKAKHAVRRRLRRAAMRMRRQIRDLIAEIHWKAARWLCLNFETIYLPTFETQQMVTGKELHSKVARMMLTWSHFLFKQRIKHKANELGAVVKDVNEAYTSKTCSSCGKIHENMRSKKWMRCECLPLLENEPAKPAKRPKNPKREKLCRDFNGARGIFIKSTLCEIPPAAHVRRCIPGQTALTAVGGVC
jgi:putative transposase